MRLALFAFVLQLTGRPGAIWGDLSGQDKLVVVRLP